MQYGLWDQIRVDQGKEWVLMLYIQGTLAHLRHNTSHTPHLQSTSKQVCFCQLKVQCNLLSFDYIFQESYSIMHLGGD